MTRSPDTPARPSGPSLWRRGGPLALVAVAAGLTLLAFPTLAPSEPPAKQRAERRPIPPQFLPGTARIAASGARFSPDGTRLLVLGEETRDTPWMANGLSLWDVSTGKRLWRVTDVHLTRAKFSADGKTLACLEVVGTPSPSAFFEVRLRDARTGERLPTPPFPAIYGPGGFALSPHGDLLALTGFPDVHSYYQVRLLDTKTGAIVRTFDGVDFPHPGDVAFSPDGRYLAARPNNDEPGYNLDCDQLVVFEAATGRCLYRQANKDHVYPEGISSSIPVGLDPVFFTTKTRLVCSNSVMDLDRPPLYPRSMLSRAARYLDIKEPEGSRLFVGFLDAAGSGQGSRAHLALFLVRGWSQIDDDAVVEQLELWDIETRKRIWVMPEPEDSSRLLDYSSVTHLLARRSIKGIVTLQRL